ncbi:MAG: TrkH family potassium uptake protein [Opitutales bacterium]|nr:TrkH family potassium uptake protein [Opitutales bacterium]
MNYSFIFRLLSYVCGALTMTFLLCAGIAVIHLAEPGEGAALGAFFWSALTTFVVGITLYLLGRSANNKVFRKEALALVGLSWILASILGTIPFLLGIPGISVADAFFESTSGLTTTGSSVLSDLEELPFSLLFWRQISQWMGGMGVIVFFVAILGHLGVGAKMLFTNESTSRAADFDQGRVQTGVKRLFMIYLGLTVFCFLSLLATGLGWFEAIAHTFTTVATGGFSTRSGSVSDLANPAAEWVMIGFMILGSCSFFFLLSFVRQRWKEVKNFTEVKIYLLLLFFATIAVFLSLSFAGLPFDSYGHQFRAAAFQVVSLASTCGYVTEDYDAWPIFTHGLLLVLMLVGGCSGSTAGGLKVVRLLVGVKIALNSLEKTYRSHVVRPVIVNGRPLDTNYRDDVLVYIVILVLILVFSILVVSLAENSLGLEGVISAVIATLFNIGPGFGEVGPTENFSHLNGFTKVYLSILMIIGRIELFAILVLFTPALWKRFH